MSTPFSHNVTFVLRQSLTSFSILSREPACQNHNVTYVLRQSLTSFSILSREPACQNLPQQADTLFQRQFLIYF